MMTDEDVSKTRSAQNETLDLLGAVQRRLERIDYYLDLSTALERKLSPQERPALDQFRMSLQQLRGSLGYEQHFYRRTLNQLAATATEPSYPAQLLSARIMQQNAFVLCLKQAEERSESLLEQQMIEAGYDARFAAATACEPELLLFVNLEQWRHKYGIPKDVPRLAPVEITFLTKNDV